MLDALSSHNADITLMHRNKQQLDAVKTQLHASQGIALHGGSKPTMEDIELAAKDFESVFLNEMLKPMFDGISSDPLFGGGQSEEIFKDMMLQEYGKLIAENSSIGIADFVKAEMLKIQESQGGLANNDMNTDKKTNENNKQSAEKTAALNAGHSAKSAASAYEQLSRIN